MRSLLYLQSNSRSLYFYNMDKKIFQSAEKILAMRMHSVKELQIKLCRKFPEKRKDIEKVIDYFLDIKALDDLEFAKMHIIHRQLQKPKSEYVLKRELQQKGVDTEVVAVALEESPINDKKNALQLAQRKLHTISNDLEIAKKKERIFRYLSSQGFSYGIIQKTIDSLAIED